jgi:hypothetical protein
MGGPYWGSLLEVHIEGRDLGSILLVHIVGPHKMGVIHQQYLTHHDFAEYFLEYFLEIVFGFFFL